MGHLIAAYSIIAAAVLGYVATLWLRERASRRRLEALLGIRSKR